MKIVVTIFVISMLLASCRREPDAIDLNVDPEFKVASSSVRDFLHKNGVTNAETIDVGVSHHEFIFRFGTSGTNEETVVFSRRDRSIKFQRDIR